MAPGYLSVGLGLTYTPTAWLTVIVSPATYRATFVCNDRLSDAGAFGVKSGHRILNEFGANIRAEAKTTLWKNCRSTRAWNSTPTTCTIRRTSTSIGTYSSITP